MAANILNYTKFIHRVIKFVARPTKVLLPELENSLIAYLFSQFKLVSQLKDCQG